MRRVAVTIAVSLAMLAAPASVSAARVSFERLPGFHAPGTPAKYNKVGILKVGPRRAPNILVLNPGTSASAAYFGPLAKDVVRMAKGWQVWSVERRENLLEDHSMLNRAKRGHATGQQLFDYYLGWIANPAVGRHYRPPADDRVAFARRWGMRVAVSDVARVVHAARAGGRDVVLGGHSLGGWIATAYAAWDFGGRAGAADLDGLVLIDGASGPPAISPTDARRTLAGIEHGSAFLAPAGARLPWIAGVLSAVGSTLAVREPDAPSLLQAWPLLPASVKPPVPATNLAQLGHSVDTDTSPKTLAAGQAHLGGLAASGDPRGFQDGGYATAARAARAISGIAGADGTAWFPPRRLTLDAKAIAGGVANPAQTLLGLSATRGARPCAHLRDRDVVPTRPDPDRRASAGSARGCPCAGCDARGPEREIRHSDPLFDDPAHNDFLATVVPFLARIP